MPLLKNNYVVMRKVLSGESFDIFIVILRNI